MYTIRDYTKTAADLSESLKKIAAIGYPAVQVSAVGAIEGDAPEVSASELKMMLDDNGIVCAATHRGWEGFVADIEAEIEFHKTLECGYVALGGLPAGYERTVEGYRRWIGDAAKVISALKDEGIQFGYHNHSHEFLREERGSPTLEDVLIDEGGTDLMLELDMYWIAHAGANCERIIERCTNRVPFVHFKDKEVVEAGSNETTMCPVGEGNLDWENIIKACQKAGTEWYAVEQDECRRDPFDCLDSSFRYLTAMGL
jgi:sugar phosphate isomerase/epimerase